ncbi:hypothetical protein EPO34_02170 [Patescibacteria group bacterium]|nr:MAG: hypothetical protein EPO34_02170 [Patescibacteria group bacterium]
MNPGDELTVWEGQVMVQQLDDSGAMWCPDCGLGLMRVDATYGTAVKCSTCGSTFVLHALTLKNARGRRLTGRVTAKTP